MIQSYWDALASLSFPHAENPPLIVDVQTAYKLEGCRLYSVSWWGNDALPLPAGFTRCEVKGYHSETGEYDLVLTEEYETQPAREFPYLVEGDWLLLAFYGEDGAA